MSKILSKQLCYSFSTVEKLWEEGSLPLKDLGERIGLASNTLTPLLKRLEEKDFVRRLKPETDKRQLYVQLTQKGKDLENQIKSKVNTCFVDQIGFSRQEADAIIALNQELAKRLAKAVE